MNKILLTLSFLALTIMANAQLTMDTIDQKKAELRYTNSMHLGLEVGSWEYIEVDSKSNERLMSDSGNLYGLSFESNHEISSQVLFLSKARLLGGKTNYDGYLQDNDGSVVTPYQSDSQNFLGYGHIALGLNLSTYEKFAITPNIGIARRILLNPQQNSDPYDYTRRAIYDTFPLALDLYFEVDRDLAFTANATSHLGFRGETKAYSSGNDGSDRTYRQEKGEGKEFSVGSQFLLEASNVAFVKVHYKTWEVADSKKERESTRIYSLEPKNSTKEIGLNLGVMF